MTEKGGTIPPDSASPGRHSGLVGSEAVYWRKCHAAVVSYLNVTYILVITEPKAIDKSANPFSVANPEASARQADFPQSRTRLEQ
jgi:hypothetical protein